jgi:DNA modification methylase
MQSVWEQCARVLRPNGKLCINAPIMPIPKEMIRQHTRHLKNIAFDMEHMILSETNLRRYSLFIWQKQTSKMMFGSYPFPGNIIENNTVEFINVYVKPGRPPKFNAEVKVANQLTRAEWLDLTQQVWFMYPEDVKREGDHPAPFPEKLPARLMRLYTYGAAARFSGEVVLDPFVGTGTTCAVAKSMKRRYVGIDIDPAYIRIAQERVRNALGIEPLLLVGRPKYPGKEELEEIAAAEAGSNGKLAAEKHKRKTYGRRVTIRKAEQLGLI